MARKNGMTGAIPNAGRKGEGKVKLCIVVSPEIKEIIDKEKNKSKFVSTCIESHIEIIEITPLKIDEEVFRLMTSFGSCTAGLSDVETNLEIGARCAIFHCNEMINYLPILTPQYDLYRRVRLILERLLKEKEKSRQS